MRIYGLDFTSAPSKRKPLVIVGCKLDGDILRIESAEVLGGFKEFERFLEERRPWACGMYFSLGQPRPLIEALARDLGRLRRQGLPPLLGRVPPRSTFGGVVL